MGAVAELLGIIATSYSYRKFGLKKSLGMSFILGAAGSLMIMVFQESFTDFVPAFVLLCKFGLTWSFPLIYLANFIFPVKYASQSMGFCNTAARFLTVCSPLIAE